MKIFRDEHLFRAHMILIHRHAKETGDPDHILRSVDSGIKTLSVDEEAVIPV